MFKAELRLSFWNLSLIWSALTFPPILLNLDYYNVRRAGFEPAESFDDGFTVRCN